MSVRTLSVLFPLLALFALPLPAVTITWTVPSEFDAKSGYTVAMVYVSPENLQNGNKAQAAFTGNTVAFNNVSESYIEKKKIQGGTTVTTEVAAYHDTGWWCAVVEDSNGKEFSFYHVSMTAQDLAAANGVFALDHTAMTTGNNIAVALGNSVFTDLLAAPEPSVAVLLLLGGTCFAMRRRL